MSSGGGEGQERVAGRSVGAEAAESQAVGDDEHAGQAHRCAGDERVEQPGGGEGDGGDVVAEGPEQVGLDGAQGAPGQADGVGGDAQVAVDEGEVAGFDGDVGAGAHGDPEVGLGEGGGVVDAVADHGDDVAVGLEASDDVRPCRRGGPRR